LYNYKMVEYYYTWARTGKPVTCDWLNLAWRDLKFSAAWLFCWLDIFWKTFKKKGQEMRYLDLFKVVVVAKWGPRNKFSQFYFYAFFMNIWKITSILVLVLFWYMARKALFDGFRNISYEKSRNFLIFGNLKHD
jgi:hypothetical protein